jgi:hypothetical protein
MASHVRSIQRPLNTTQRTATTTASQSNIRATTTTATTKPTSSQSTLSSTTAQPTNTTTTTTTQPASSRSTTTSTHPTVAPPSQRPIEPMHHSTDPTPAPAPAPTTTHPQPDDASNFTSIVTVSRNMMGELVYDLPEIESDYSDEEGGTIKNKLPVPEWAQPHRLQEQLRRQRRIDPETIFGRIEPIRIDAVFRGRDTQRYRQRTSSAHWIGTDRLTEEEEQAYRQRMGYI